MRGNCWATALTSFEPSKNCCRTAGIERCIFMFMEQSAGGGSIFRPSREELTKASIGGWSIKGLLRRCKWRTATIKSGTNPLKSARGPRPPRFGARNLAADSPARQEGGRFAAAPHAGRFACRRRAQARGAAEALGRGRGERAHRERVPPGAQPWTPKA